MATLTTNQITLNARKKILEATGEIVDDSTLLLYANLTQDDIVKKAFPNNAIATAVINFTDGEGTLPSDFGTLYGDAYRNERDFYPELSIEDFNKKTLSQAVTIEDGVIKVYPEVSSLNIKYHKTFPAITSGVNPSIHHYFHECIIYGIVYRAFEDLQDFELATAYETKYEKILEEKIATLSNYEETNQRSGQMFSHQDLTGSSIQDVHNYF